MFDQNHRELLRLGGKTALNKEVKGIVHARTARSTIVGETPAPLLRVIPSLSPILSTASTHVPSIKAEKP